MLAAGSSPAQGWEHFHRGPINRGAHLAARSLDGWDAGSRMWPPALPGGTAASFLAATGQEAQKPPGRLWATGNLLPVLLFNPEFPQPSPITSAFVMMPERLRFSSNHPLIAEPAQYIGAQNYFGVILDREQQRNKQDTDTLVELFTSTHSLTGQPGPRLSLRLAGSCGSPPCFLWAHFGSCE